MARTMIAIRIPPEALEKIDKLAAQRSMTRTEYLIQAGLGELDALDMGLKERVARVEARMDKLEDLAYASG